MKISKDLRSLTTTQTEMARALGVTQPRVSQLVKDGVMISNNRGSIMVVESLKNYYNSGGEQTNNQISLTEERARHEKTKREIAELKLKKLQHEVYDAKTVELVLTELVSTLRTQLLGLPTKLAPILTGKSQDENYEIMTREIEDKLTELSKFTPSALADDEIVEDDSDEDGD